ncbi:hypothetical protein ANO11243_010340 [Dothideomycetidae sp. 11243]|nr:hypothetical protein ANO11243_010340 [fungal sp. No.11243]
MVGAHNVHRANHSAPALHWDTTLAKLANEHTSQCVMRNYLSEPNGGLMHQSSSYLSNEKYSDAERATHAWYSEGAPVMLAEKLYGQTSISDTQQAEVGTFANVVWKGFTGVGCATTLCPQVFLPGGGASGWTNMKLTLCFYGPWDGSSDYAINVAPPIGCPAYGES